MDLASLDTVSAAESGAVLELRHPTTAEVLAGASGRAITIRLAGQDSERYRKADRQAANRRLNVAPGQRRVTLTAEGMESDATALMVACVIGWDGVQLDGQSLDCTPDNARLLFKRLPWVLEQVRAFVEDRGNFLKASSAS